MAWPYGRRNLHSAIDLIFPLAITATARHVAYP